MSWPRRPRASPGVKKLIVATRSQQVSAGLLLAAREEAICGAGGDTSHDPDGEIAAPGLTTCRAHAICSGIPIGNED